MSKSAHYELKKKYYELLAADPDYPAWPDFEWKDFSRMIQPPLWRDETEYRYNPLPKKWEPKGGWSTCVVNAGMLNAEDVDKLQAYAVKLSWLREQGGYEFVNNGENYIHSNKIILDHSDALILDCIYMNREQAEKWLELVNNGEV